MRRPLLLLFFGCVVLLLPFIATPQGVVTVHRISNGGASPTPTPCADFGCISGLQLWIKANAITGKSDGDALAHTDIVDSSGLSHGPTSSGGGGTITYRTNIQDSQPAIRFADKYFEFGSWASGFTSGEIWIVIKLVSDPPGDITDTGLWDFSTSTDSVHFPYTDGDVYESFGSSTRKALGNPSTSLTSAFVVWQVSSASGAYNVYINGNSTPFYTSGTNTVAFPSTLAIGASQNRLYRTFGDVLQVVVFDKNLSGGERASGCDGLLTDYPTITCAW